MSKENVQKFYELLMNDKAVADELQNIAAGKDIAGQEEAATLIVEFAAGKGFDFTAGELAQFEQENQRELTPEELEKINAAGGGYCAEGALSPVLGNVHTAACGMTVKCFATQNARANATANSF